MIKMNTPSPLVFFQFVGWTLLSNIPLWIWIYFDKKDDGAWMGLLGGSILNRNVFFKK